ncbi:MAG: dTDP-4-dehydrorhamnose 3,5-epimerase [Thermoanaerobaculales bacterium]|jgi:dTDP-4-dehydrorhamnose 3,5-epimerase|nr:dTDP-4-dehydrorhamnose 3,5-epimerase [Thermoanaerobaculales bacterium]
MRRIETEIPGVCLIEPVVHGDHRGFFMESYNRDRFRNIGIERDFVQDNHSRSRAGVLRGLHYQLGRPQAKLVRATRGRVYDVVVDLRRGSPTFARWVGAELSEENRRMLFAPEGFGHGFVVLSRTAEFQYKCSDFYAPDEERGIRWDDPTIAIDWPLEGGDPILSDRDLLWPHLADAPESDFPRYQP